MDMFMEYVWAFLIGGLLCAIGQVLIDLTKLTPARILTSYVVAGVILGGLGWYQPIIDLAGGGATVPLTGFGSLLGCRSERLYRYLYGRIYLSGCRDIRGNILRAYHGACIQERL